MTGSLTTVQVAMAKKIGTQFLCLSYVVITKLLQDMQVQQTPICAVLQACPSLVYLASDASEQAAQGFDHMGLTA